MTAVHASGRCQGNSVVVYVQMHLTAHHRIVAMDKMVHTSFQHSPLCIFGLVLPAVRQFLPALARVRFRKVHRLTQQQKDVCVP